MGDLKKRHTIQSYSKLLQTRLTSAEAQSAAAALAKKDSLKSIKARQDGNRLYVQKGHNQEVHSKVLSLYTQSAAFAESDSEELALAYGNRSALLMHLQRYEECLVDIDRAQQITKSEKLKAKLAGRRVECLALRNNESFCQEQQQIDVKTLLKASKEIPCASESITIKFDEKYGRHVVATEDIKPGTVITVEKAYATVVKKPRIYLNCAHCLNLCWNAIPCDSCTTAIFCSEKCKENAWLQYHDVDCSIFPLLDLDNQEDHFCIKLAIRVFIVAVKKEGLANIIKEHYFYDKDNTSTFVDVFFNDNIFQSSKFKSIYNLCRNNKFLEIAESIMPPIVEILYANTNIFDENTCDSNGTTVDERILLAKKILSTLYVIMRENDYSFDYSKFLYLREPLDDSFFSDIPNKEDTQKKDNKYTVGSMIAPFCSLFNHSCCDNISRFFTPNQEIVFFTRTSIKKGEQLYSNYGPDMFINKAERQHEFQKSRDCSCFCQACEENWQTILSVEQSLDRELTEKIFNRIMKIGVEETTFSILVGSRENIEVSNKVLKDFVKLVQVVNMYCSGFQAYVHSLPSLMYFLSFFGDLYGMKNDVPYIC